MWSEPDVFGEEAVFEAIAVREKDIPCLFDYSAIWAGYGSSATAVAESSARNSSLIGNRFNNMNSGKRTAVS
ncbi:MAG: hypothetical protein R3B83_02790 [Nitrospirales bacterium]|nr:hypothetical protein [Nitrospirales bacterium]